MSKFYIQLGFRYSELPDTYSHLMAVYGPYDDDKAIEAAIQKRCPDAKKEEFLIFDGRIFIPNQEKEPHDCLDHGFATCKNPRTENG